MYYLRLVEYAATVEWLHLQSLGAQFWFEALSFGTAFVMAALARHEAKLNLYWQDRATEWEARYEKLVQNHVPPFRTYQD